MGTFLGCYKAEEREKEMIKVFKEKTQLTRKRRRDHQQAGVLEDSGQNIKKPSLTPPRAKSPPKDSLKDTLDKILGTIDGLLRDAKAYEDEHVTQEYRRINADCIRLQMELDRLNVEGREDCRKLRKSGILKAEEAAETLSTKTHQLDPHECPKCLKL